MKGTYEWNPMPHRLDVACPTCGQRAEFEFAEVVRISLKSDVAFFQKSCTFDYQTFQDSCGHLWHGALFFEGLHGSPGQAIHQLPPGYLAENWAHSKYLRSADSLRSGAIRCAHCCLRAKHQLAWPNDAYYAVAHRRQVLWAFYRESAVELLDYLSSTKRDVSKYRWASFLLHIPSIFSKRSINPRLFRKSRRWLNPGHANPSYSTAAAPRRHPRFS
ncbi:MAG: hypothetical protein WKG03_03640, partial [Telluria sp.]